MITSTSNAQIKELAKLQKKSRLRDERRIFLVEGPRMVEEIPKERIERLYISESFERKNPAYIRELGMPAGYQKTFEVCGCISGGSNKNGCTTRISADGMPEKHDRESQGNVVVSGS